MELEHIKRKLETKKGKPLGIKKNFAVLLPLIKVGGEVHILYQVRSMNLYTQPGEISFPGGKVEKGETFKEAAIRETKEELNINEDNIKIIGELDFLVSPYNFNIYGYVGEIDKVDVKDMQYNTGEVDHLFTVPLDFFINNEPLLHFVGLETIVKEDFPFEMIQNGKEYNWKEGKYPVYFYEYSNYIIWGITARFTKNFIDILKDK